MSILSEVIARTYFKRKWRKKNKHNQTMAIGLFDDSLVTVGNATYGGIKVLAYNKLSHLKIGNYCSIGPETIFVLSADHYLNHLSTYPFKTKILSKGKELEGVSKGDIVVGDDVWFGCNVTVLSGVTIGQGAVIAAGTVVTKNIPPYAIAGGVPAKILKYRFSQEIINYLLKLDFNNLTTEFIKENEDFLYQEINSIEQVEGLILK